MIPLIEMLKVTISRTDLECKIQEHDHTNSRIYFDLETDDFFTKSSTESREVPSLAIPIPCWDREGFGDESEALDEFINRNLSYKERKIVAEYVKNNNIGNYELLDHLSAREGRHTAIADVSKPVRGFDWNEAWDDDKDCQISVMADDWLTMLEGHEWSGLLEDMPERLKDLEIELTILSY